MVNYLESNYVKQNIEHWIPSGISLYEEIFHLVPNHYLDFNTMKIIRYWPNIRIKNSDKNNITFETATLLENSLKSRK